MSDILKKLDERINRADHGVDRQMAREAKAEIEKLRAENKRLRAALEPFAKAADGFERSPIKNPEDVFAYAGVRGSDGDVGAITVGDLRRARAALEGK
jgi:hypothetical protein